MNRNELAAVIPIPTVNTEFAVALAGRPEPDWRTDALNHAIFWADVRAILRHLEVDAMIREGADYETV